MHKRLSFLLGGILLLALPASGTILTTEVLTEFQFSNLGRAKTTASATGLATVNGSGGLGHLNTISAPFNAGLALSTIIQVTDPIVTAGGIVEVRLTAVQGRPDLQGGVFGNISGALQNTQLQLTPSTLAATGQVRLCLFYTGCNSGALTLAVGQTNNGVFIGGGVGGVLTIGGQGTIRISIVGGPWTVKTVSVSNRTDNGAITTFSKRGFAHGPASLTSSTAAPSGVVQLVTASRTTTVGVPGNSDKSGNITFARTHFVPEPGMLLLLGAGAAGMVVLGRRRLKK